MAKFTINPEAVFRPPDPQLQPTRLDPAGQRELWQRVWRAGAKMLSLKVAPELSAERTKQHQELIDLL